MKEDIIEYLTDTLKHLQEKRNFNPNIGTEQIKDRNELAIDYGQFKFICQMIKDLDLSISILYENEWLEISKAFEKLYFIQETGTDKWKIGCSNNPYRRNQEHQVSNSQDLSIIFTCPGNRKIESALKTYLRKYKIKGEWFKLSKEVVDNLIKRIKKEGTDFLFVEIL